MQELQVPFTQWFLKVIQEHEFATLLSDTALKQFRYKIVPAIALLNAGFTSIEDIVSLVPEKTTGKRGRYKKESNC